MAQIGTFTCAEDGSYTGAVRGMCRPMRASGEHDLATRWCTERGPDLRAGCSERIGCMQDLDA